MDGFGKEIEWLWFLKLVSYSECVYFNANYFIMVVSLYGAMNDVYITINMINPVTIKNGLITDCKNGYN